MITSTTLRLHQAKLIVLPQGRVPYVLGSIPIVETVDDRGSLFVQFNQRSEEHTSELQSPCNLVCRLLLEKKKECITGCRDCRLHRRPPDGPQHPQRAARMLRRRRVTVIQSSGARSVLHREGELCLLPFGL